MEQGEVGSSDGGVYHFRDDRLDLAQRSTSRLHKALRYLPHRIRRMP